MSHEMTAYDQMFSVRERPWHADETNSFVLADYPGRDEAYVAAGHDFEVVGIPLFDKVVLDDGTETYVQAEYERRVHGKTGERFMVANPATSAIVQNEVGWDITEAILGQDNVLFETAGTLKGGAVCWVLARLDEPSVVKGDDSAIFPFVSVSWSHDGSKAIQARATQVRIVCWNTMSQSEAEGSRTGREFTFRHTKNVMKRIAEAKNVLLNIRFEQKEFMALSNELASMPITDKGIDAFVHEFLPSPPPDLTSERVKSNIEAARNEVYGILNGGLTITEANRNTAYGLVQAGVEYLDHIRGYRDRGTYLGRTILRDEGAKKALVPTAMRIAQEFAPVAI